MGNSIKQQLFSGVLYTALAKYSGIIMSLIVAGVLSRILSPDDFGVMAIATVIISFFSIFTDMGLSTAIIQHKFLTKNDLSQIYSFTIWMGSLLALGFFFLSWTIASYYQNQTLKILCQLLSINLFFSSINIVPNALFYKDKKFKFIAMRSFIIQIITGISAILSAFLGAGLYALIISPILSSVLMFFISFHYYPQQLQKVSGFESIQKIFSYSAYQFLFSIINYFSRNLDKLLIGKYLNLTQLGYYEKSYRLMMLPLQNITQVITPVMHPILSDFQNNKNKLAYSYERIIRLLAFIGFPLSVFLFFTAKEITLIIFGNQWIPSIPVFKILTLSVGTQIVLSSSGSIFQATGDTKSLFICGAFSSILNVSGIIIGTFIFKTLDAIAWCITITFSINFVQCYWQMYRVTLQRNFHPFIKQLCSPFCLSIILIISIWPISCLISYMNIFLTLAIKGLSFILVFGIYIQLSGEYNILAKLRSTKKTTKKQS